MGLFFQSQLHGDVRELNLRESPGNYSGIECCWPKSGSVRVEKLESLVKSMKETVAKATEARE